ncbi:MAG: hypothetical protein OEZ14_07200 [Acidimicrobiia bacterium]|nr:hypothetical protein [Acidimicrobiia bacterium]MDH5520301.1 hypothetical protein [Acidimicrobiia bacterium]
MNDIRSVLIYSTYFVLTAALGVVFVLLEDLQARHGLADWEVGLIAGTGFGAALVVQTMLSPLADRGVKVPLSIVALGAGVLGPVGLAYGSSTLVLAGSRGLSGIGLGLFALLARKALIGLDATGGGAKLGMLLSVAVAGFISGPFIGYLFEPWGFEAPFLAVSAALIVVGAPATMAILRSEFATTPVDYSVIGQLLRRPRIQSALLVQCIVLGYVGVFDSIVDRFLTDLGASTGDVARAIMVVGFPMLILPRIAGNWAEALGGTRVMLPALLCLVPIMVGYSLVPTALWFAAVGLLHGSAESFASISSQVLVLEVTGAEKAAVGTGLLDAAGLISAAVAAGLAPLIYGASGKGVFVITASAGAMFAGLALWRIRDAAELDRVAAAAPV